MIDSSRNKITPPWHTSMQKRLFHHLPSITPLQRIEVEDPAIPRDIIERRKNCKGHALKLIAQKAGDKFEGKFESKLARVVDG